MGQIEVLNYLNQAYPHYKNAKQISKVLGINISSASESLRRLRNSREVEYIVIGKDRTKMYKVRKMSIVGIIPLIKPKEEFKIKHDMRVIDFINIVSPLHDTALCNDENLDNGFYSNDFCTKCIRCTMLQILKEGYLPESHWLNADFNIDIHKKKKELR